MYSILRAIFLGDNMALTNIFSIKKQKADSNSPIQGAMSKLGQATAYTPPNYAANVIKNTASAAYDAGKNFLTRFDQPQQTQSKAPLYSAAPKPQIQGSGITSQYATNPTNYKPTAPVAPALPQVAKPPSYVDMLANSAQRRTSLAEENRKKQEDYIKQKYALSKQQLSEQLPTARGAFNTFKANTEATIGDILAGGERQKAQTRDYYGEAQRLAAQTNREGQAQNQRTFAALNTLDSRGEGSFAQANENQTSEFNRYTQQNLRAQADKLSEIDAAVGQAEREARAVITQEEAKLGELERSIQYAIANNNLEEAQQLTQAYNDTQQLIYDIQDSVEQARFALDKENAKLQQAAEQVKMLSPEFLQTGRPTTQADAEFIFKNKDNAEMASSYAKLLGTDAQAGNNNQNKALTMVNNILSGNIGGISGAVRTGNVPLLGQWTGAATTQNDYDGLKALLSLAERGQLKGSGAVSDFEAQVLEKAALAGLGQNLPTDEFERRLRQLKAELESGGATDPNAQDPQLMSILGF